MKLNPNKLKVAEVMFSQNSPKTYAYFTYDEDIKPGDLVVVDSRTGMSVAKVHSIREPFPEGELANRFVIQAISLWPLRQSMRYIEGDTKELPLPSCLADVVNIMTTETLTAIKIMTKLRAFENKLYGLYGDIGDVCDEVISDIRQVFKEVDDTYGLEYNYEHDVYMPRRSQNG